MTVNSLFLIFFLFIITECLSEDGPSIVTNSGKIRGRYLISYKGNKYEAYQGIPYAEPPVGDKRFQPPVPIQPWSDELNATQLKKWCPQSFHAIHSEDCLYLNVYVPTTRQSNETLPVILYIHGGNYLLGGSREAEETYIMDHEVIFVSTQYRLGILGFMSTEDEVVSGNMGLKDQSTALRWVHDNIEHFDGDPKRITLIGQSSGGASVHFHYLSPWSAGLFHAGLSMSGTAFATWSMPEQSRQRALELGQNLNCTEEDVVRMIKCLKSQPVEVLVSKSNTLPSLKFQPAVPYGPVVESKSASNPFIDDLPTRLISKGKVYDVPWITGVTSEEGLIPVAGFENVDPIWHFMAPILLDYFFLVPKVQHSNVSQAARQHYFGEKLMIKENMPLLVNLATDRLFKASAADAAQSQAAKIKSPVFFYHYAYRATDSMTDRVTNSKKNLGVCHGDDIGLVLKGSIIDATKSANDLAMQERLIKIWTSVARDGIPKVNVEWSRVSQNSTNLDYLQIDDPSRLEMKSSEEFGQKKFWKSVISNEDKI